MKNIIYFETADELVKAYDPARPIGDDRPFIPSTVRVILGLTVELDGEGSDRFLLSDDITSDDVIYALAKVANVQVAFIHENTH
jgi:hypothetical protein